MTRTAWIEDIIVYPTVVLAFISLVASVYVTVSSWKLRNTLHEKYGFAARLTHDYMITELILWLGIINMIRSCNLLPEYGVDWKTFNFGCLIVGFIAQFSFVFICLWHILIASYLFYLLVTNSNTKRSQMMFSFGAYLRNPYIFYGISFIIVMLCFISAVVPLLWNNNDQYTIKYNYIRNNQYYGPECVVTNPFEFFGYGTMMIAIIFEIIVLLIAICKYVQTKKFTNAYLHIIKKLSMWVIVFLIVRILPFMDRFISLIDTMHGGNDYKAPLWLVLGHNYSIACNGIANGIVWYFSNIKWKSDEISSSQAETNSNDTNLSLLVSTKSTAQTQKSVAERTNTQSTFNTSSTVTTSHTSVQ